MSSPCFGTRRLHAFGARDARKQPAPDADGEKIANDAMIRSLDLQQHDLQADAEKTESVAEKCPGCARVRWRRSRPPTSLRSNQASQLMQIRALLIAQQNAEAARQAKMADIEAQQAAAAVQAKAGHVSRKARHVNGKGGRDETKYRIYRGYFMSCLVIDWLPAAPEEPEKIEGYNPACEELGKITDDPDTSKRYSQECPKDLPEGSRKARPKSGNSHEKSNSL